MGVDNSSGDKFRRTFRLLDCTEPKLCKLEMESMADEIDALRAAQHDMAKCPNCEKCITDLRADNAALRAEVERMKTKAEIGEFVMEAVRQSARNKSTITAIVRLKDSPCKP